MYTYKRMFITVIISVFICSWISIAFIKELANKQSEYFITHIFSRLNYEYSLSIPNTWNKVDDSLYDMLISNGKTSIIALDFVEKGLDYDALTYENFIMIDVEKEFDISDSVVKKYEQDNVLIYETSIEKNDVDYFLGYIDYQEFMVKYRYIAPKADGVYKNYKKILTSIKRFLVEEVSTE